MPERAILPKPYQKPHPPMWVAVTTPGTELDAADRGLGSLGLTFGGVAEQEKKIAEYRRRIQSCDPVGDFVNEQVNTVNFLYCHEDAETGVKTGQRLLRHVQLPRRAAAGRARGVPDALVPIARPAAAAAPGIAPARRRRRACRRASASATRERIIEVVKQLGVGRRRPHQLPAQRRSRRSRRSRCSTACASSRGSDARVLARYRLAAAG